VLHQAAVLVATGLQLAAPAAAVETAPCVGDGTDCIGEVDGTLNTCALDAVSCVSSNSDDEQHFLGPWAYDGSREEAVAQLIRIATGLWGRGAGRSSTARAEAAGQHQREHQCTN
jgi:uncharacterized protein (DUF1499 family)